MFSIKLCLLVFILKSYVDCATLDGNINKDAVEIGPFKLTWVSSADSVDFVFRTKVAETDSIYSAFGFSKDLIMGNDDIAVCMINNNKPSLTHSFNPGKTRPVLLDDKHAEIGFSKTSVKIENGELICSFTRQKVMSNVKNFFDLNEDYHLIFGKGPLLNGVVKFHTERARTLNTVNFKITDKQTRHHEITPVKDVVVNHDKTDEKVVKTEEIIASPHSTLIDLPKNTSNTKVKSHEIKRVQKSQGHIQHGPYKLCWSVINDNTIQFKFKTNLTELGNETNVWSSFSFGDEKVLGERDINLCMVNGKNLSLQHYHSVSNSTPSLLVKNHPEIGYSNVSVIVKDGILKCLFNRMVKMSDVKNYFDLNREISLQFNNGVIENDEIQFKANNATSSFKINLMGSNFFFSSLDMFFQKFVQFFSLSK